MFVPQSLSTLDLTTYSIYIILAFISYHLITNLLVTIYNYSKSVAFSTYIVLKDISLECKNRVVYLRYKDKLYTVLQIIEKYNKTVKRFRFVVVMFILVMPLLLWKC